MLNRLKIKKNYMFKDNPIVSIILDKTSFDKISLKKLLQSKLDKLNLYSDFKIQIILPDNLSFIINDDLLDLQLFSRTLNVSSYNLEFILNKNSKLDYSLNTDSLKTCRDFCTDCPSCKKVEKIKSEETFNVKELNFKFLGTGSVANIKISLNGAGSYFFDLKTVQDHKASNSKSDLVIKAALSQNSRLRSDNLIRVSKDLKKVEANQVNKNLLLGCFSKAICIPKLEVESSDVVCKHGAAVSRLDKEKMFYLQSRGIDYCNAKETLIKAFLRQ